MSKGGPRIIEKSKDGPRIIEKTGLLALTKAFPLVTLQDMVATIMVTTHQEALPMEGPNQTEVEECHCPMRALFHTQILVVLQRTMTRPILIDGTMIAGMTTT